MKHLKVALVHDYIKEYGGAERVLETLHELFPDAPVYTSVYIPEFLGPHKDRFKGWEIHTSWLQHVPFKHKLISPFRLVSPWIFKEFDLSDFDVVIVSATGAYFPNMIQTKSPLTPLSQEGNMISHLSKGERGNLKKRRALHICYCHTPPRYLYGYATARDWKKHKVFAVLGALANHFLRLVDFTASKNVDYYIANSQEVVARIKKFYRRDATVIYPPVEVGASGQGLETSKRASNQTNPYNLEPKTYFLTGGRLARAKHVDLIVRACAELGVPLKVFGRGFAGYEEELKREARGEKQEARIEFLGEVTDEEKAVLMHGAKAFLFAAEDEDSGITPVEAMAAGTPVIAYRSGGIVEKITEGKTGIFFDQLMTKSLQNTIKRFEKMKFNSETCKKQANQFSKQIFMKKVREFMVKVT
jgi:glycosyltransferase involved in cell wall biosynthesis